jgi:hypothetical protein
MNTVHDPVNRIQDRRLLHQDRQRRQTCGACATHALLVSRLAGGLAGCGDLLLGGNRDAATGGPAPPTVGSDLETLALITQAPNPETGELSTYAQLAIMSLEADPPRYLGGLTNPTLLAGALEIPLLSTDQGGVFGTDSLRSALRYQAGATYTFRFTIIDAAGVAQTVTSTVTAPETGPRFEVTPLPVYLTGEPIEVSLLDLDDGAVVATQRLSDDRVTFSTFAYTGPATLRTTLNSLLSLAQEPVFEIPGTAFAEPGEYVIEVHSYGVSSDLTGSSDVSGPNSWLAAGTVVRQTVRID